MTVQADKQEELVGLLRRHASVEGPQKTSLDNLFVFRASEPLVRSPTVHEPLIVIAGQGRTAGARSMPRASSTSCS